MKKKQDKNSYPWIKRLFGRKTPIEGVYAGPEQMNGRFNEVYAGPPADKEKPPFRSEDQPMACVYAGPEYFAPKEQETDGSEQEDEV